MPQKFSSNLSLALTPRIQFLAPVPCASLPVEPREIRMQLLVHPWALCKCLHRSCGKLLNIALFDPIGHSRPPKITRIYLPIPGRLVGDLKRKEMMRGDAVTTPTNFIADSIARNDRLLKADILSTNRRIPGLQLPYHCMDMDGEGLGPGQCHYSHPPRLMVMLRR